MNSYALVNWDYIVRIAQEAVKFGYNEVQLKIIWELDKL